MIRDLKKLSNSEYDIIIIGGGMFGAAALWEAAHRGLSACLVERGDFCEATSANHFKMVHGGIRYIQHGDLVRLRESSVERSAFLRIAPHLVTPLPILIPTYGHLMKGKEVLRTGMFLYDSLTLGRNIGIKDKNRKIPSCYSISKNEVLNLYPGVKKENLTGGAIFHDAQMYNPPRLVLSFIKSAVNLGADAANYLEAKELIIKNNKCSGVRVKDKLSDEVFEINGKLVLSTLGPWAANFLQASGIQLDYKPSFSRDTAFVLKRKTNTNIGLATTIRTKDVDAVIDRGGRHLFIVPWIDRDILMIGVWHIVWDKTEDKVFVTEQEIEEFLQEVNEAYPDLKLNIDDISLVNTGLTLFGETTPGSKRMSFGKRSLLLDHSIDNKIDGVISLIGVRATMGRGMAEKAINLASVKLNKKIKKSQSKYLPLAGGEFSSFDSLISDIKKGLGSAQNNSAVSLGHNYGTCFKEVIEYGKDNPELLKTITGSNVLKAEIMYIAKNEMAMKLKDAVLRRTDLGTAGYPGKEAITECADIMAETLNWDDSKKQKEINEVESYYHLKGSIKSYSQKYEYADQEEGLK